MAPETEPCQVCGEPIVWALNETCTIELKFKEGRLTGGYQLVWRPSINSWQTTGYRRHNLGVLPSRELVYPRHECKVKAKKAWTGDPRAIDPWRKPSFKVPQRLDTVDGLPDPF
jgi:hypothetical protein